MNNGYTAIFSPCFSMFLQLFSIFHPFVHVPGAASSCASCASAVRPTPNHASWWEKWAPPGAAPQGANAVRTEMQPECWKKTHTTHEVDYCSLITWLLWFRLLFIDYLTIIVCFYYHYYSLFIYHHSPLIIHWLLLFTILDDKHYSLWFETSLLIDYCSLITWLLWLIIHYWWLTHNFSIHDV